jgi:PAS domain S-box-containing protein
MKVTDIDPEPPTAAIKKIMNESYKTGNKTIESWHRRQDGSKFPVEISGSYITYENKNLAFTLARNISERKQFERQLSLLNHALDQSKDAVYLMANQGQFLYVNDTACTMLGYDRQELLQMQVTDIDPDIQDFQIDRIKRQVIESGTYKFEARHRRKNNSIFPVEISISIINFENQLISFALVSDITERKNKEVLLQHQVQQIRSFSSKIIKAREIERRLIAHELHDEFGQILTGIKFSLEDIKHKTTDNGQDKINHIQKEIGQLINQIRNLSISLRPPLLDDLGLLTALKWHIERYSNSTGVLVDFLHHGIEHLIISDDNALVIFRIIQESLTNIARHANSQRAKVHLIYNENEILINICDDGKGFDLEYEMAHAKNIGIIGMRERLEDVGGVFSIKSKHGVGTEITAKIPINIK